MTMLEFLRIRRDKVARLLNFEGAASATNQIANFALAHFDYQKEHIKTVGTMPADDQHSLDHTDYINRVRYQKKDTDMKDKKAGKKKRLPAQGKEHYQARRKLGQDDLPEFAPVYDDSDELALDIAEQIGGDDM